MPRAASTVAAAAAVALLVAAPVRAAEPAGPAGIPGAGASAPGTDASSVAGAAAPAAPAPQGAAAPDARPDPARKAFRDDIRRLVTLTGNARLGVQIARQLVDASRPRVPTAPQAFWDEFLAKLDVDELVERVIPIYEKNLSPQDVKDLIAFYESPAGQHLIRAMPSIVQDSLAVGQAWGREIAAGLLRSARAKGFDVKEL